MPASTNGPTMSTYGVRRCRDRRDPGEPDRLQREARAHQPVSADPVGQRAGDRGDDHRHRRPRQDPQAGGERRVALHGLEELREQEDRAEHPEREEERRDVRERERPVAEEAHRQHRRRCAELPQRRTAAITSEAADDRAEDRRRAPPERVAANEAPDDAEQADAGEPEAGQVEPTERAAALVEPQQDERDEHEPDRHVQPEDPLPRDARDDGAADERAERDGEAA